MNDLEWAISFWAQRVYSGGVKPNPTLNLFSVHYNEQRSRPCRNIEWTENNPHLSVGLGLRIVHGFSCMLPGVTRCVKTMFLQNKTCDRYGGWWIDHIGCIWEIKISKLSCNSGLISQFGNECFTEWLIFEVTGLTFNCIIGKSVTCVSPLYIRH